MLRVVYQNIDILDGKRPIYNNFKRNIQTGVKKHIIVNYSETLYNLNDIIGSDIKSKILASFLKWIAGDYLLHLGSDLSDRRIDNLNDYNNDLAPFEVILNEWSDKLLHLYSDGQATNEDVANEFEPIFNQLEEVL